MTPIDRATQSVWARHGSGREPATAEQLARAALTAALSDEDEVLNVIQQAVTSATDSGRTIEDPQRAARYAFAYLRSYLIDSWPAEEGGT